MASARSRSSGATTRSGRGGFLVLIGGGSARGADLLDGGVLIWATNLLLFAVLYWEHAADGARQALMAVQGLAALITTGVVVARAVSLLG